MLRIMKWPVTIQYDGAPAKDHGPVSPHAADDHAEITSAMICTSADGTGTSTINLVADADTEADAHQAARAVADRWAAEVGIPVRATVFIR